MEPEVEIYRSHRRADCAERSFMLGAVGIASQVVAYEGWFLLQVAEVDLPQAMTHLAEYERENLPAAGPPRVRPFQPWPHAWVGCVLYAAWLLGVAYAISNGLPRVNDFARGDLYAAAVQGGQWWRAWTALTIHLSGAHLAGNLLGGIWFGYLAGQQFGVGTAWLLTVVGAGIANLVEAVLASPDYRSAGASTAVFTALGMMAAHTWRLGLGETQGWWRRWAPLGAGVALLAWLGTAGKHTDIMAHLLGFGFGCLLGWLAAQPRIGRLLPQLPQWLMGLAALAIMVGAWTLALT